MAYDVLHLLLVFLTTMVLPPAFSENRQREEVARGIMIKVNTVFFSKPDIIIFQTMLAFRS